MLHPRLVPGARVSGSSRKGPARPRRLNAERHYHFTQLCAAVSSPAAVALHDGHDVRRPARVRRDSRGFRIATVCYRCYTARMKGRIITQRELRNQSAAVLREVEAGRTLVVMRNGTPIGELRPIRRRRFVPRAAISDAATRAPRIDADRFRADLDAVINPHIND